MSQSMRGDMKHGVQDRTPIFFIPLEIKSNTKQLLQRLKTFCLGETGKNPCPVRAECLWDAVSREEPHGIWGGLSHRERNALVRKWSKKYKKKMTLEEFIFSKEKEY